MGFRLRTAAGIASLLLGALGAPSARAEVYRWIDESGQVHFTADLSQVPPQHRANASKPLRSGKSTVNQTAGDTPGQTQTPQEPKAGQPAGQED